MAIDLRVSPVVDVPAAAEVGSTIQPSWTIENAGSDATMGNWYDAAYLSTDTIFDPSDRYIWSNYVSQSLLPGSSYSPDSTLVLPNVAAGNYYLLFLTDVFGPGPNRFQIESDETNNIQAVPISLSVPDVDLIIGNATASATSANLGDTISVGWTVTNQGGEAALGSWFDYLYLSDDQTLDSSDTFVSSNQRDNENPLTSSTSYTKM
jgi:large repetitive protein